MSAPPQLSPDGHWWWDGHQWIPAEGQGVDLSARPKGKLSKLDEVAKELEAAGVALTTPIFPTAMGRLAAGEALKRAAAAVRNLRAEMEELLAEEQSGST